MENEPRKGKLRGAFKILLYTVAAAVYIVFFVRFFVSCDSKISDDVYLTSAEAEAFNDLNRDFPLYHYQPISWTSEDGTLQISNIFYIEEFENLQLTVRHKTETYSDGEEYPFKFNIRVVGEGNDAGEVIIEPEVITDKRFGYTYARLVAGGVISDHGREVTYQREEYNDDGSVTVSDVVRIEDGTRVWLDIYDLSGERLFIFEIAGKNEEAVNRARIRRKTVDVIIKD